MTLLFIGPASSDMYIKLSHVKGWTKLLTIQAYDENNVFYIFYFYCLPL